MKYDIVCAREILRTLEAKEIDCSMSFIELNNSLPTFSGKPCTVQYTCLKLEEAGYIKLAKKHMGTFVERITDVTVSGHNWLNQQEKL